LEKKVEIKSLDIKKGNSRSARKCPEFRILHHLVVSLSGPPDLKNFDLYSI
jgi:hypothetical protein